LKAALGSDEIRCEHGVTSLLLRGKKDIPVPCYGIYEPVVIPDEEEITKTADVQPATYLPL